VLRAGVGRVKVLNRSRAGVGCKDGGNKYTVVASAPPPCIESSDICGTSTTAEFLNLLD